MQSFDLEYWRMIAMVLDRVVNNLEAQHSSFHSLRTKFDAIRAPNITLHDYFDRLHKFTNCSDSCYIVAFIYIDRVLQKNSSVVLTWRNIHRIVLIALLLAIKFFDDEYADNLYYSKVGGITLPELNSLEREMLILVNFNLHIDDNLYSEYLDNVKGCSQKIGKEDNPDIISMEDLQESNIKPVGSTNSMGSIRTVSSSNEMSSM